MSNGGLQQGSGAEVATEAREVSLVAVRDDAINMQDGLTNLAATVQRLQAHLMGDLIKDAIKGGELNTVDRPSPSGELPSLCDMGMNNIHHLHRIQEQLNQLCYQLGEGR